MPGGSGRQSAARSHRRRKQGSERAKAGTQGQSAEERRRLEREQREDEERTYPDSHEQGAPAEPRLRRGDWSGGRSVDEGPA